ncbi:SigE family RNA polymerase sigma factor [Streptomyces sp. DB-54]
MSERDRRQPDQSSDTTSEGRGASLFDCPSAEFDALYGAHAEPLTQQALVLTGRARLARRAVERAFRTAWQRWPEVAAAPDPVGWVRAAAHDYALAPWRRLFPGLRPAERPGPGTPAPPPAAPGDHALLVAVLALPAPYRRALLLHDGLGLGLHETAVEVEASTPAATGRLAHAREWLAERLPELGLAGLPPDRQGAVLHARLGALAASRPVAPPPAREVRADAERWTRLTTRAGFGAPGLLAATALAVTLTAPDGHHPPPRPAVAIPSAPSARVAAPPAVRQVRRVPHHRAAHHRAAARRMAAPGARLAPEVQ